MPYAFKYGDRPLDGLTVQRAVGRGGFGEVYYALMDSGKEVALKYLRENPELELRGVGEVMNLKSPNLITIYDVKRNAGGEPFVIMEYASGPSLRDLLCAQPGGLGVGKAVYLAQGIAAGLAQLHARGIVHRDLKPANIFFDAGYVKIGDYGLTKHMAASQHSGQTISVGTVYYMAPEIGSGQYSKLVDIYALGVPVYEMLTGQVPFTGASLAEVLVRQLRDRPDLSRIPAGLAPVLVRALEKDPAARYQDVQEFAAALASAAGARAELEAFDPLTLTQVPRRANAVDELPPWERPAAPTLDARAGHPAWASGDRPRTPAGEADGWQAGPGMPFGYASSRPQREFPLPTLHGLRWPLSLYVGLVAVALFARWLGPVLALHNPVWFLATLASVPVHLLLVYRWWSCLPARARRTDPVRGAFFLLIPFYNLYWGFVAYYGLALDLNEFRRSAREYVRAAPERTGLALAILTVLIVGLSFGHVERFEVVVGTAVDVCAIVFALRMTHICQDVIRWRVQPQPAIAADAAAARV